MAAKQIQPLEGFVLISRPRWMWLLILTFAVIAMLVYGFLGAVPRTVQGSGITRDDGRILDIATPQAGIVERVLVKRGDKVEVDTPILVLRARVLESQLESARNRLDLLEKEDQRLTATAQTTLVETANRLASAIRQNEESIRSSTELLEMRQRLLDEQEKLLKQGFVAKETVLGTRTTVAELRSSIESARSSIAASRLEATQSEAEVNSAKAARREAIQQAEASLLQLEKRRSDDYTVRSVVDGTVVEISTEVGQPVDAGERIITLTPGPPGPPILDVIAFIPQAKGKEIKAGDAVQVSPTFASRSRYGFIKGTISEIDVYAATDGELSTYIQSSSMISDLKARYTSLLITRITLEADPNTESGLAWSTKKGWPGKLEPGTLLDIQAIFRVDRPIDLLLPWLRSLIGE